MTAMQIIDSVIEVTTKSYKDIKDVEVMLNRGYKLTANEKQRMRDLEADLDSLLLRVRVNM